MFKDYLVHANKRDDIGEGQDSVDAQERKSVRRPGRSTFADFRRGSRGKIF